MRRSIYTRAAILAMVPEARVVSPSEACLLGSTLVLFPASLIPSRNHGR